METSLRDHDYFETIDGWIFCVIGEIHPPGRVFSFLKYIPGEGPWRVLDKSYTRLMKIYSVEELLRVMEFIERERPEYLYFDETVSERIIAPPASSILRVYSARSAVEKLLVNPRRDDLSGLAYEFLSMLSEQSGVKLSSFGISGSLLLGNHHKASDIDILVYGREEYWRVLETIEAMTRSGELKLFRDAGYEDWLARASRKYPLLSVEEIRALSKRISNKGFYKGRKFSIYGVRSSPLHTYGEVIYEPRGSVRTVLEIKSSLESGFTPAIYFVEKNDYGVDRIVTYDMMLACLFRPGDTVEVSGKLEHARRGDRVEWRQILVGSFKGVGKEYIKLIQ